MRRMLFPTLIALPVLGSVALFGLALLWSDTDYIVLGVLFLILALLIYIAAEIRRLTTDHPPGVMFSAGVDSERQRGRRRRKAKRNRFHLLTSPIDDDYEPPLLDERGS